MTKVGKVQTKIPPLEVTPDDPFEGDALGRQELCEQWTNFIENSTTPYVMAIDGKWGTGKTTLLHMWAAYLEKQGFKCVKFNAWQADFYGQALPALIGEITRQFPDKKFTAEVKKISGALFTQGTAWKIISAIAKEVPGGKTVAEISKAMADSWKGHDAVEHYKSYRNAVDKFKKSLKKFASGGGGGKPLVIFVDELDRCRPDFALDVLEKAKHIFDVEAVFFVFAVNREELGKTIQIVYGKIDSERYLRKFFDHAVILVNRGGLGKVAFVRSGLKKHLDERTEWLRASNREVSENSLEFYNLWFAMIKHFNVSLRDEEQILSALNISFQAFPRDHFTFSVILVYFSILKVVNPNLYGRCKASFFNKDNTSFPYEEFTNYYRDNAGFGNQQDSEIAIPIRSEDRRIYMRLCAIRFRGDEEFAKTIRKYADMNGDRYASFCEDISRIADDLYMGHLPQDIASFFETIDSIGDFQFKVDEANE